MSKKLKAYVKKELSGAFAGITDLVLVDSSRLKAQEAWTLRGKLAKAGMNMKVVKNSLASVAFQETGLGGREGFFDGPTSVVYGGESAAGIVRTLEDWNRSSTPVVYKGGYLEGVAADPEEVKSWARLPTKVEMLSQILGLFMGPAAGLAGLFTSTLATFPNLVAAHLEKLEKQQEEPGQEA